MADLLPVASIDGRQSPEELLPTMRLRYRRIFGWNSS